VRVPSAAHLAGLLHRSNIGGHRLALLERVQKVVYVSSRLRPGLWSLRRTSYPSDLSDAQWRTIALWAPEPKSGRRPAKYERHVVVDTLGLLRALVVTPAHRQDSDGGRLALEEFRRHVKFPKIIWANEAYRALVARVFIRWLRIVRIVARSPGTFQIQPSGGSPNGPSAGSTAHAGWRSPRSEQAKATMPSSPSR